MRAAVLRFIQLYSAMYRSAILLTVPCCTLTVHCESVMLKLAVAVLSSVQLYANGCKAKEVRASLGARSAGICEGEEPTSQA